ncbi:hypothetical protein [Paenibacillus harenae]|uniref:hypothetical protein n=1 Tax=Paenibacillus harenae TaxID=306543 RepID=UPI00278F5B1B|nr:hypothetical protein [Paenibacillus harenae]MDQ0058860.1 flagellar biosynthesis/type III secretory pathway protein FliH [Paenibacillus harenae]
MLRNRRKSTARKTSSLGSSAKRTGAGMKGSQRKKTLLRRNAVQRKRLSSDDKELANQKFLYNDGYNTGFAKGFEDGHQKAYEQNL